jgi:glutamyl/glutaminyl-tRNA synthetase
MREEQGTLKNQRTKYDRFCHGINLNEVYERIENGEPYVIRMLIP